MVREGRFYLNNGAYKQREALSTKWTDEVGS